MTTLSHDAYVVRWQQDVMPITDVTVLRMLVSDEQLRELAKDALELSDEELNGFDLRLICMTQQDQLISDFGATIQVIVNAGWPDGEVRKLFTNAQRSTMRRKVLAAWEENFSDAYRKAAKARELDWHRRLAALREKQTAAEERAGEVREAYAVAERQLETREEQTLRLRDLDQQLAAYRMRQDEMAARRAALESQIQQFENQDPDANAARRKSAKIIEQYKHALALEERRLMELRQRRADEDDDGEALNDQIHQAELRVMEARIAIEQALQEMETDERKEAMLEELRNANLELMQVANTIHGIEQRREEILAGGREPLREVNEVGVKQARMEYELAEHRLMRLNERLADLEDSGENVVAPLTFIRLSK